LTHHETAASVKGYTLVTPMYTGDTYLLDMDGRIVHQWHLTSHLRSFYGRLLPSGNLLMIGTDASVTPPAVPEGTVPPFEASIRRIGGNATHLREVDWDGNVVWEYANQAIHHDFVRLENGHTLVLEFNEIQPELAKMVRGGYRERNMGAMISDAIVEVDREGKTVRRVHLWELLDPRRDPMCPMERRLEWTHGNGLDVFQNGDILFSCRNNSTVGVIDTKGKLTWKIGWPTVSHQHHATVLANGHVQVFDNGMHRRGVPRSAVLEIDPKDSSIVWQYTANPDIAFLSANISGAERMQGGNVLICEGAAGRVFEVTPKGETVWEWITPFTHRMPTGNLSHSIFRAHRYSAHHPALAGRELDPAKHAAANRMYGLA
jgi:hypothetical protein